MKRYLLALVTTLASLGFGSVHAAATDTPFDMSPLIRHVNEGNTPADIRVVAPRVNINASTRTVGFYFDVYTLGAGLNDATKAYSTPSKSVVFSSLPCTSPVAGSTALKAIPHFNGREGGSRTHAVVEVILSCVENTGATKSAGKVFVYSAEVAQATGPYSPANPVWVQAFGGKLLGKGALDANGDTVYDTLTLAIGTGVDQAYYGSERIVAIDFVKGTILKDQGVNFTTVK